MSRSRAERLRDVARSKGIEAKALGTSPAKPSASTPWLYLVLLRIPEQPLPAWCHTTKDFFRQLRWLLAYQKACKP